MVNYVGNGTNRNFSIGQLINSAQAVIVKITDGSTSLIQTMSEDFNVNYPEQLIEFDVAPETNQIVSIYSFGFSGSNILDLDYFIGTGTISEFVSKAPWSSNITALVYINGVPEEVELFETDDTYENSNRVGIRFNMPPVSGDIINFVIVSGNEQTFAITKTERIATDGRLASVPYSLTNKVGNSQPAESNMIVRVNQEILSAPSNSYFTIKGNKLTYLIDNSVFPPYSLQISDIIVYIGNKTLALGTDYIVDLSVISVKITNNVRSVYAGQQLVVSIVPNRLSVSSSYTYLPGTDNTSPQIRFSEVYSNTDVVEVISSYKHDILDIQRTAVTITSTVQLTPSTLDYYNYVGTTGGYIKLNRSVINESYVWVTKNNKLLTPSIDYKLNSDRQSIKLTEYPEENDLFSVITYSSDILTDGIAYMQFKDMLNRVHYKRLSANKQTQLINNLNYNDTVIELIDASNFDIPNPTINKPGIIEIRGERIEYFTKTGNVLGQLRRGTLGTGTPVVHQAGAYVQDIGPSETIPYIENTIVEQVVSDGSGTIDLVKILPSKADNIKTWFTNFGYTLKNNFSATIAYKIKDVVIYNNTYYKCMLDVPPLSSRQVDVDYSIENATYWEQYISIPTSYGKSNEIEVFVGGYTVNSEWASGVAYTVGSMVTIGSYTYRCLTAHTSTTSFHADITNWSFFIGNIRLKKDPYKVHNVNVHHESPEGDIWFDPEFAVDGELQQVRLTTPVAFGTQVTVIKRSLMPWDGKYNTINIRLDDNKIAGFLRATPGIWYSSMPKND